jgi:hypothetical protein
MNVQVVLEKIHDAYIPSNTFTQDGEATITTKYQ